MSDPMSCARFRDSLGAYVYGDLTAELGQELAGHVNGCADCRRLHQEARRTLELLDEYTLDLGAPETPGSPARLPRKLAWWRRVAVAAAVLLPLALALAGLLQLEVKPGAFTLRLVWSEQPGEAAADRARLAELDWRLKLFEERHEADLLALALSADAARREADERLTRRLDRLASATDQELRRAQHAFGELVMAFQPSRWSDGIPVETLEEVR